MPEPASSSQESPEDVAESRELRIEQKLGSLRFVVVVVVDSTGAAPAMRRIKNQ